MGQTPSKQTLGKSRPKRKSKRSVRRARSGPLDEQDSPRSFRKEGTGLDVVVEGDNKGALSEAEASHLGETAPPAKASPPPQGDGGASDWEEGDELQVKKERRAPDFSPALLSLHNNLRSLREELDCVEMELKGGKDEQEDSAVHRQIELAVEEERAKQSSIISSLRRELEKERRLRVQVEKSRAQEAKRRMSHPAPDPLQEEREEWKAAERRMRLELKEEQEKRESAENSLTLYIRNSQQDPQAEALRKELREAKEKAHRKESERTRRDKERERREKEKDRQVANKIARKDAQIAKLQADNNALQAENETLRAQLANPHPGSGIPVLASGSLPFPTAKGGAGSPGARRRRPSLNSPGGLEKHLGEREELKNRILDKKSQNGSAKALTSV